MIFIILLTIICESAMIAAVFLVHNSGIGSIGIGLIITFVITIIYMFLVIFEYKTVKKTK